MKKLSLIVLLVIISAALNATPWERGGEVSRKIAAQGMVLLTNKGALPLTSTDRVGIYGADQHTFIYGGGGSANIVVPYKVDIPQGMANRAAEGKITLDSAPTNAFKENPAAKVVKGANNTAVVIISRRSREGIDRTAEPGDWFLTDEEKATLSGVKKAGFDKFVVVLNVAGVIDTSWVDEYDPDAILLASLPGNEGGNAVADVLVGDVTPSGKLTDSWAYNLSDYPGYGCGSMERLLYKEDIYVGYRYFTTFNVPVRFPFGHGLSYTTFNVKSECRRVDDNFTVSAKVTNTGRRKGAEVVQVYASAPQSDAGKPAKVLVGFGKTRVLEPGEYQTLNITFNEERMASVIDGALVLEKGRYKIYADDSLVTTVLYPSDKVLERFNVTLVPKSLPEVLTPTGYRPVPTYDPEAPAVYRPKAIPISGDKATLIEAEDYYLVSAASNRDSYLRSDGSRGVCVCRNNRKSNHTDYMLKVPKAGRYTVSFAFDKTDDGLFNIRVQPFDRTKPYGEPQTNSAEVKVDFDGEPYDFRFTEPVTVELPAGEVDFQMWIDRPLGNFDRFVIAPEGADMTAAMAPPKTRRAKVIDHDKHIDRGVTWDMVKKDASLTAKFVSQLSDRELATIAGGSESALTFGTGVMGRVERLGVPGMETFDGGAGVRLGNSGYATEGKDDEKTTCMPAFTLLASSWDTSLVEDYADVIKNEKSIGLIHLAPGINIHKDPLCGRNFEYFSEDPLLTGKFAAALCRAGEKRGYIAMCKHFFANSTELNRNACDSCLTDRAAREIYMKAFEIAVKEGGCKAIMTSYNYVNGREISESGYILDGIVRGEWGFRGFFSTDWNNNSDNTKEVLAGNNIKMSRGNPEMILADLEAKRITRERLEENAMAILGVVRSL
ncbi:MAG: glycoside hydrolase family 3 C-terminal domain-containing protein [Abditibacteriota bacterium]|nr:glycoside hydrolase family 3 C-terminal domain-containing protein [Abditibacteriota bacterium]